MYNFSGLDANTAIVNYWAGHAASLPEHIRSTLSSTLATKGNLEIIITTMEGLYAARAEIETEGLELLEGLARFVSNNNFHGKQFRASQISGVATRILDEGEAELETDPEIDEAFMAPEPEPEPEPEAEEE